MSVTLGLSTPREWKVDMNARTLCLSLVCAAGLSGGAHAQEPSHPSGPIGLAEVLRLAAERRPEIAAARARARAAEARPAVVGALEDPMVSASLDHLPFSFDGADVSLAVEQRFPLSKIRDHRRAAARADLDRFRADVGRTQLDVALNAGVAFLMLQERRRMSELLQSQLASARDVVAAAAARYSAATGPQADVLTAEVDVARMSAEAEALTHQVRAAEAMLNTSLALDPATPVPPLAPPAVDALMSDGRASQRPELEAARAAVRRAGAEVDVMKAMFRPMATVRTGPAYTMAEGGGLMLMVGVSIPLRRAALRAGVAEAEAMRDMAASEVDAMRRMFDGEAATARHERVAALSRYRALHDDVLPRARAAIGPSLSGYAAGQLPLTSVVAAVQSLWRVEEEVIDAELRLGLSALRLQRALGSFEGAGR